MSTMAGAPSAIRDASYVVAAQKVCRLGSGDASRVKLSAQVGNPGHENLRLHGGPRGRHETQIGFLVGKRMSIARRPDAKGAGRCVTASGCEEGAVDGEMGVGEDRQGDASPSGRGDGAECGVHVGRRMLLGSVFTAVALSKFSKPGLALAEGGGNGGNEKVRLKGGDSSAGVAGREDENARAQFGEKWKMSRVYDATVLGEPVAVGGDRSRVWEKLLQARVVYLGEAERVPDPDDRVTITSLSGAACLGFLHYAKFWVLALE